MDITQCVCCLLLPPEKDLKSKNVFEDSTEIYSDMLSDCFNITFKPDILRSDPGICHICVQQLRAAVKLKKQILTCQRVLQSHGYVKEERVEKEVSEGKYESVGRVKKEETKDNYQIIQNDQSTDISLHTIKELEFDDDDDFDYNSVKMSFKIVSTIEKGKSVLTTIPSHWENDGSLFWPRLPKFKVDKIRRSGHHMPEDDWKVINCIVKRRNLKTFNLAEVELEKMCTNSDTKTDSEKEKRAPKNNDLSLEKLVQGCLENPRPETPNEQSLGRNDEEPQPAITQEPATLYGNKAEEYSCTNIPITITKDMLLGNTSNKLDNLISKFTNFEQNQTGLQANMNILINTQKTLLETQERIVSNLSLTLTQFDQYVKINNENKLIDFERISDLDQLKNMEISLESPVVARELKTRLMYICGKGKGRGINNAYSLIDAMFDRKFLKLCSWAGGSRSSESKVCFKSFVNVIKFFFEIVFDSDNSFTLTECHSFFKVILKNSTQRCKLLPSRRSMSKQRPKKKHQESETISEQQSSSSSEKQLNE